MTVHNLQLNDTQETNSPLIDDSVWNSPIYRKTKNGITSDLPYQNDVYGNAGYVIGYRYNYQDHQWDGVLHFINVKNEIWSARVHQDRGRDDRHFLDGGWKKIGSSTGGTVDLSKYVIKSEKHVSGEGSYIDGQGYLKDANVKIPSGMYKVSGTTINLPSQIGEGQRWGVLLHFVENEGTGACYQLYAPIDGNYKGNLYMRIMKANTQTEGDITPWFSLNIPALSQVTESYFNTPEDADTISAVTPDLETGYYKTKETTTGMEGVPDGKKDGILKVIKDDTVSIQEYTPAYVGDNDYYTRTIPIAQTQSTRLGIKQFEKATGNNQKIIKEGRDQNYNPLQYATSFGDMVIYEYKLPRACDLTNKLSSGDSNLVLLKTMVATDTDTGQQGMIYQVAYAEHEEKVFMRRDTNGKASWGQWHQINQTGGGSGSSFDHVKELARIINLWDK